MKERGVLLSISALQEDIINTLNGGVTRLSADVLLRIEGVLTGLDHEVMALISELKENPWIILYSESDKDWKDVWRVSFQLRGKIISPLNQLAAKCKTPESIQAYYSLVPVYILGQARLQIEKINQLRSLIDSQFPLEWDNVDEWLKSTDYFSAQVNILWNIDTRIRTTTSLLFSLVRDEKSCLSELQIEELEVVKQDLVKNLEEIVLMFLPRYELLTDMFIDKNNPKRFVTDITYQESRKKQLQLPNNWDVEMYSWINHIFHVYTHIFSHSDGYDRYFNENIMGQYVALKTKEKKSRLEYLFTTYPPHSLWETVAQVIKDDYAGDEWIIEKIKWSNVKINDSYKSFIREFYQEVEKISELWQVWKKAVDELTRYIEYRLLHFWVLSELDHIDVNEYKYSIFKNDDAEKLINMVIKFKELAISVWEDPKRLANIIANTRIRSGPSPWKSLDDGNYPVVHLWKNIVEILSN